MSFGARSVSTLIMSLDAHSHTSLSTRKITVPRGAAVDDRRVELAVSLAPLLSLALVQEPDQKVPWFRREPPLFTNLLWRGLDLPYRFRKRTSHAPPPPLQPAAGRGSCTNRGGLPSNDKATLRLEQTRETPASGDEGWGGTASVLGFTIGRIRLEGKLRRVQGENGYQISFPIQ